MRPVLSPVVRAIDVRPVVGQAVAIDRGIRRLHIEVSRLDLRHLAPGGHRRRSDIVPVPAVVAGLHESDRHRCPPKPSWRRAVTGRCVYTTPKRSVIGWSISFAVIASSVFGTSGFTRVQVWTDLHPGLAAVARAEHELIGVIERFVGRREDLRQGPGLAIRIGRVGGGSLPPAGSGRLSAWLQRSSPLP